MFICSHCEHVFKTEKALDRHQNTSLKCLEIQGEEIIDDFEKAKNQIAKLKKQIKEFKEIIKSKDIEIIELKYFKNNFTDSNVKVNINNSVDTKNLNNTIFEFLQHPELKYFISHPDGSILEDEKKKKELKSDLTPALKQDKQPRKPKQVKIISP